MLHYKLYSKISYPDRWFLGDINVDDNWIFTEGIKIDVDKFKNLAVQIDQEGIALDYTKTNAYAVPIVSESFAECLYGYMSEIQLIPVSIPNARKNYFIFVVVNKLECVDEKKSDFIIYENNNNIRPDKVGDFEAINILKLDKRKIDKNIFRISRYEVLLIINEKIKITLESAGLLGLKFEIVN